jgi:Flp pilus assembly protein CpaB
VGSIFRRSPLASSSHRRRRLIIAVVAALIAAGSVVLLVNYVNTQRSPGPVTTSTPPLKTERVVVATADLAAGAQLSGSNIGLTEYPVTALPASPGSYYTDTSRLLSPPQFVSSSLPKGTLILSSLLVATASTGPTVTQPPIDIKNPGDVAIAIPYGEATGAGGYVQAEDHIDILVDDGSGNVHYAFQDVRVIKVGGRAEQGSNGSGTASLLLVELSREQAATLAYIEDHGFSIRYVIRPHDEFGAGALPHSSPVGGSNWTSFLDG